MYVKHSDECSFLFCAHSDANSNSRKQLFFIWICWMLIFSMGHYNFSICKSGCMIQMKDMTCKHVRIRAMVGSESGHMCVIADMLLHWITHKVYWNLTFNLTNCWNITTSSTSFNVMFSIAIKAFFYSVAHSIEFNGKKRKRNECF